MFEGSMLSASGIVVVTINYRLGPLGELNLIHALYILLSTRLGQTFFIRNIKNCFTKLMTNVSVS